MYIFVDSWVLNTISDQSVYTLTGSQVIFYEKIYSSTCIFIFLYFLNCIKSIWLKCVYYLIFIGHLDELRCKKSLSHNVTVNL